MNIFEKIDKVLHSKRGIHQRKEALHTGMVIAENDHCNEFIWIVSNKKSYFLPLESIGVGFIEEDVCHASLGNYIELIDEENNNENAEIYVMSHPYNTTEDHCHIKKLDADSAKLYVQEKIDPEGVFLKHDLNSFNNFPSKSKFNNLRYITSDNLDNTPIERIANLVVREHHHLDAKNLIDDGYAINSCRNPKTILWMVNYNGSLALVSFNNIESDENVTGEMRESFFECYKSVIDSFAFVGSSTEIYIIDNPKNIISQSIEDSGYFARVQREVAKDMVGDIIMEEQQEDCELENYCPRQ